MNAKVTAAKSAPVQMKATHEERYDRWRIYMNYLKAIKQGSMIDQEKQDQQKQDRQKVTTKIEQNADYWLP